MYLFVPAFPTTLPSRAAARCCTEDIPVDQSAAPVSSVPTTKKRLRGRVAYDGTNYSGWQFQVNARTVQREIEKVVEQRFGQLVRVVGASRTDTGVHARGQAFHMDLPANRLVGDGDELQKLQYILNQMLPADIRISHLGTAPYYFSQTPVFDEKLQLETTLERRHLWSAIYDTIGKLYTYRFSTSQTLDPLLRLYCHREWRAAKFGFCEQRMHDAITKFEGTHDFSAFANALHNPVQVNPVRTIRSIRVVQEDQDRYRLEFRIDGALYKMIRNVVGTILDISCFQLDVDAVGRLFESKDRRKSPKSAPAHGLCLEEVFYNDWPM